MKWMMRTKAVREWWEKYGAEMRDLYSLRHQGEIVFDEITEFESVEEGFRRCRHGAAAEVRDDLREARRILMEISQRIYSIKED